MPKIVIDDVEHDFEDGITLIQACELAGVPIPRFCYHERLSIAGNCRMCLVEVKGLPKPIASCALSLNELRPGPNGEPPHVITKSEKVKKAREGVMEFLLINHPLDCPICDQGGECDLQDQAMSFGVDNSRFALNKRAVEDKNIGPTIKTIMTRCIHCTRCVRFMTEVAGVPELGAIGRGEDAEITTYLERGMQSELSANIVDLCPVGALTSKPYAFTARPWELRKTESVDVMDALGSNIRIDTRGREVMRVMPRNNDDINEEWISDKTRFIWEGLRSRRLDRPYIRENSSLRPASWDEALQLTAEKMSAASPDRAAALAGDLPSVEEMAILKEIALMLDWKSFDCRQDGAVNHPSWGRSSYIFNSTVSGIDQADAILLIGTNPRLEAAVLNARIHQRWRRSNCPVGVIGERADLTYKYEYLGAGPQSLSELINGQSAFSSLLKNAERPLIVVGAGVLARSDARVVLASATSLAKDCGALDPEANWAGLSILQNAAARVGGLDIGFVPEEGGSPTAEIIEKARSGQLDLVYLLGADEIDTDALSETFVIYQGTHGDKGAHIADIILPGAAYTEKSGTYVNLEGRPQMTSRACFPPGEAKEDWAILRALSGHLDKALPFDSLGGLRSVLYEYYPHLAALGELDPVDIGSIDGLSHHSGQMDNEPFLSPIQDYYLTNPIARASSVMKELNALQNLNSEDATGTDG